MILGRSIRLSKATERILMTVTLQPATSRLGAVVRAVKDEQLGTTTPSDISVGDLLDHVRTLAAAFTAAAKKEVAATSGPPPRPSFANLAPDWRETIPAALDTLAGAWSDGTAWTGMTRAGGIDMPGEAAGIVALDEVVLHGWDLARATGQPYEVDDDSLHALMGFLHHMAEPAMTPARQGLFGPVVAVGTDAPLLDRVVGLAGRDPAWSPR
jgi:uncharacterized protein (TIGR03086 family)